MAIALPMHRCLDLTSLPPEFRVDVAAALRGERDPNVIDDLAKEVAALGAIELAKILHARATRLRTSGTSFPPAKGTSFPPARY